MASTYMEKPYYPAWLDNLADDVTGEGGAWDGAVEGARRSMKSWSPPAKYEFQEFHYAGPYGKDSFLEDYTSSVGGGVPLYVVVLLTFNADGKAHRLEVNHRPRSSLLLLSRLMLERFACTPLAKHWEGTP